MSEELDPIPEEIPEKKNNSTIIIIAAIVLVLCCFCVAVSAGVWLLINNL